MRTLTHARQNSKSGVALFFAVLFVSAALVASLGVSNLVVAEFKNSREFRKASRAFTVANTGLECTLFWALKQLAFRSPGGSTIECFGQTIPITVSQSGGVYNTEFTFPATPIPGDPSCFKIKVIERLPVSPGDPNDLSITSLGQDDCTLGMPSFQEIQFWYVQRS